jgi:hypothetical protein
MSAGARKPNASALVGMVAAASGRAAVSTTAILPNFSIMTHPSIYLAVSPRFCGRGLRRQTRHKLGFPIGHLAISRDMVNPRTIESRANALIERVSPLSEGIRNNEIAGAQRARVVHNDLVAK